MGDENESLLRKVLVTVECSYQLTRPENFCTDRVEKDPGGFKEDQQQSDDKMKLKTNAKNEDFFVYEICTINLDSKLKWPLMDGIVSYVFKRYLNKIDPNKSTGLDKNSIEKYYIGDCMRKINDTNMPDLLPYGYLVGNNCTIKIILKGTLQFLKPYKNISIIKKNFFNLMNNPKFLLKYTNQKSSFCKFYIKRKLNNN